MGHDDDFIFCKIITIEIVILIKMGRTKINGTYLMFPFSLYLLLFTPFCITRQKKNTWTDINECEIDNGNCSNGTCKNTNGSFYCLCHKGFVLSEDDKYKCIGKGN